MSVFVVIFSVVVFMLAGLLVDGGAAINARLRASDIAEQAARAAADRIDIEHLRATGQVRLLGDGEACGRAQEIVSAHGDADLKMASCEAGAAEVTVTVTAGWKAAFLAAFGYPGTAMSGTATAAPDTGDPQP
ncbi:pilus assembly protein TadG-related protein [Sphaerisporangium sp. B11E5]|uniref:pilus assembly protein TadG-related protein n=1 Tax=Sphaerisporangium sp. B11E5 TaxID=3153563 RepID=UPI00325E4485